MIYRKAGSDEIALFNIYKLFLHSYGEEKIMPEGPSSNERLARKIFLQEQNGKPAQITWMGGVYGGGVVIQYRTPEKPVNSRTFTPEELAAYKG